MSETNGEAISELYKRYRPRRLEHVLGQEAAVKSLEKMIASKTIPHAILLSGPSGSGKTTAARILKRHLKCGNSDFVEINAAESRGIDTVREIQQRMHLSPMPPGKSRIWLLDECARLTNDSQSALLKILEDTPSHVYFILATTDPQKMLSTIRTRCTEIAMKPLNPKAMQALLLSVAAKEETELSEEVVEKLVELAEGSARKALVLLHQIIQIETPDEQLEALQSADTKTAAIELARALLAKKPWAEIAKILKAIEGEDPEGLRRMILGYSTSVVLGGGKLAPRAASMIDLFRDHWYDCGRAGLVITCYHMANE